MQIRYESLKWHTYNTLLHWETLLVVTASDSKDLCDQISFLFFAWSVGDNHT